MELSKIFEMSIEHNKLTDRFGQIPYRGNVGNAHGNVANAHGNVANAHGNVANAHGNAANGRPNL